MTTEPTIQKTFRVPADLWESAMQTAADRDVSVSEVLRGALTAFTDTGCDGCGACDVCGGEVLEVGQFDEDAKTATVSGYGRFDETTNPDVQALIDRATELLRIGAVGVSVALDADPADMPDPNGDVDPEAAWDAMEDAHSRVRHVAIVDTPAFSGAYLDIAEDGTLSGPLVFEGIPTGDGRGLRYENITLDESLLPIPIIFDLTEGDHTGVVIGHIDRLERTDGIVGAEAAPLVASLDAYPAYLFDQPDPTPMTVHAPDASGYRRYSGILVPAGVCHKGRGGCYTYKGYDLGYFHSGARIPLDNGEFTRVGPLMFGGLHADDTELDYATALTRAQEDARTVFSMGRVFHHPAGLLYSGVLMPDADIMRVQATAPSVEAWPDHRGRLELKTALQVPRPAYPVAASLSGGGVALTSDEQVFVELEAGDYHELMQAVNERIAKLEANMAPLLAAHMAANLDDSDDD